MIVGEKFREMKRKFTKKQLYAVEYAGYWNIQDKDNYDGKSVLDAENVGLIEAAANAKLFAYSPKLMTAFVNSVNYWIAHEPINFLEDIAMTEAQELIKEILK